jgi:hypothetical protein
MRDTQDELGLFYFIDPRNAQRLRIQHSNSPVIHSFSMNTKSLLIMV